MKERHGMSYTPTWKSFANAMSRCTNPHTNGYANYGGRGIQFRFKSYAQFLAEVGLRPEGMTLDRKDKNGHYEPGNIKWATILEQNRNRRCARVLTANGQTMSPKDWAHKLGWKIATIWGRIHLGWTDHEIVNVPIGQKRRGSK